MVRQSYRAAVLALLYTLGCARAEKESPTQASSASASNAVPSGLSSAARGKEIFLRGQTASGESITAMVGAGNIPVEAKLVPCAGCHGKDARGRSEGGASPSNVRWEALTRPYEVTEGTGRHRPPYTDKLFVRAVTMGLDAGGTRLDPTMPRYQLTLDDAKDLTAYLETIGQALDPGIGNDEVRIGAFFPEDEGPASPGALARAGVQRLFDQIQKQNGIFGRRLTLTEAHDARMLDEHPFAVIGVLVGDEARKVLQRAREEGIPVVGVVARETEIPSGGTLFTLLAGLSVDQLSGYSRERYGIAHLGLAATDVLVEGLRRSGRETSRERLVSALEAMHDYTTGLLPPVTFSKSRRIGVVER